jgi:hypothetical protein
MPRNYNTKKIVNIEMTSMYNKLCNKQLDCFLLVSHICIREKDHQLSLIRITHHLILSSCACFMATFSSSILFYKNFNNFKDFHKLQGYFNFI